MVRVGLIGFGLAGQAFHAPVICGVEGMELACILERHGSLARKKDIRMCGWRAPLEELLTDEEIRLCVVATPKRFARRTGARLSGGGAACGGR